MMIVRLIHALACLLLLLAAPFRASCFAFRGAHRRTSSSYTISTTTTHLGAVQAQDPTPGDSSAPSLASQISAVLGNDPQPIDHAAVTERHKVLVRTLKSFLFDNLYRGETIDRSYARFSALETIARMPYFSYLSVLHLMETLGQWRRAELLRVHFAESWNELHHLLICEELGGSDRWRDRFIAQHVAFFYYWIVVALYLTHPATAYNLNQCVEEEAYETYDKFLTTHADYLKSQPAPKIAVQYYSTEERYLFDAMHTGAGPTELEPANRRRPRIHTLYDTFAAIRDDELEHARTMEMLQYKNVFQEEQEGGEGK